MNLLFLDTETTGLKEGRLVQLAVKSSEVIEPLNVTFQPPIPIEVGAMATHHITNEMVADCKLFAQTEFPQILRELLEDHIFVAHNAAYDIDVLAREGIKVGKFICTKKVAYRLIDSESHRLQYLRYLLKLNAEGKAHDAEGDVNILEALFNHLFELMMKDAEQNYVGEEETLAKMIAWSSEPFLLKDIRFGKHKGRKFEDLALNEYDYLKWMYDKMEDLDEDMLFTLEHYLKPNDKRQRDNGST